MACPLNATTGFQTIQGQINGGILESIQVNGSPGIISFAPRQVAPALVSGHIDESTNNTVTIKGHKYTLYSTQLCEPTHRGGFSLPGEQKTPVLEVVLTCFAKLDARFATFPSMVLLIIPIYQSANQEKNAAYLKQLLHSDEPAANLQTLFYQSESDLQAKSIQYNMCVDLVDPGNFNSKYSLNALVLYFPSGCTITQQTAAELGAALKSDAVAPTYRIPPAILGSWATVLTYSVEENGSKTPSTVSREGYIPTTPIAASSDPFKNIFQYYTKPPSLASKYDANSSPTTYGTTNQYKCMPLNQEVSVSGDSVIPTNAATLEQILKDREAIKANEIGSSGITLGLVGLIVGLIIGVILIIAIVAYGVAYLTGYSPDDLALRQSIALARGQPITAAVTPVI